MNMLNLSRKLIRPTSKPKLTCTSAFANLRLGFDRMPMHNEVKDFANHLAEKTGYKVINEAPESRVVLLSRLEKPIQVSAN